MSTNKKGVQSPQEPIPYSAQLVGGPLPDPTTLDRYEQIHPGFAERILIMAEKEQSDRHSIQLIAVNNQHNQHKRDTDTYRIGQILAISSVFLMIGLCAYCLHLGFATQAASIAGTVIVGLATVFILRKRKDV